MRMLLATICVLVLVTRATALLAGEAGPAGGNYLSVGPGHGTLTIGAETSSACPGGDLMLNSDGTYENGFGWQNGGVAPPYYGAFAECYAVNGTICSAVFDLTRAAAQTPGDMDVYVWDDAGGNPGTVLSLTPGVAISGIAVWPTVSRHTVDIPDLVVTGNCWVGYWGDWAGAPGHWFVAADLNGFGGCPRTDICAGIGFPTGWQDVALVFGPTQALGIGLETLVNLPEQATFAGLHHVALGSAHINPPDSTLCVSNIGSSGQDGVSVDINGAGGHLTEWAGEGLTYNPSTDAGASIVSTLKGLLTGGAEVSVGVVRRDVFSDHVDLTADFSGVGAAVESIEVRLGDVTVYKQQKPNGQVVHLFAAAGPRAAISEQGMPSDKPKGEPKKKQAAISINFSNSQAFNIGGVPALGDLIIFSRHTGLDVEGFTTMRHQVRNVSGGSLSQVCIGSESLRLFDVWNEGLGAARLAPYQDSVLTVTNIGSGGTDGIMMQACCWTPVGDDSLSAMDATWLPLDPGGMAPIGSYLNETDFGRGVIGGHKVVGVKKITVIEPIAASGTRAYRVTADLTPIGSSTQRIQVLSHGVLVADLPGHTGPAATASAWPLSGGIRPDGPVHYLYSLWPDGTTITVDANAYVANELRILPEGPPVSLAVAAMSLTASGISQFTLNAVETVPLPPDPTNVSGRSPDAESAFGLTLVGPNPSSAGARLQFAVPTRGRITAAVYDAGGRMVRQLVDRVFERGVEGLVWDGRNDDRRNVAAGVYFVRARLDQLSQAGGASQFGRNARERIVIVR